MILATSLFSPQQIHAYLPFAAAETAYIEAEDPTDIRLGAIVGRGEEEYVLTTVPYQQTLLGVIVENPDVVVQIPDKEDRDQHTIATSGEFLVLVNSSSGDIAIGDFITSSSTPGVGVKGSSGGMVLGTALEAYKDEDSSKITPILVRINVQVLPGLGPIEQFTRTVNDLVKFGPQGLNQISPLVRYLLAIIIILIMVIGGFYMFGRIALRGIEALGRNPLARTVIMTGIITNSLLTVTLVVIGIVVAYIIITL